MSRSAALSAVATLAMIAVAWLGWGQLGRLVHLLGLGWLDPVARVALAIAALSALEAALARLFPPLIRTEEPLMTHTPVHLVTGACGNLGRATAHALAAQGARVAAADRDRAALDALLATLPGEGHAGFVCDDLADPDACARLVAESMARLGRIDGAAHTVGGFAMAPAVDEGAALWQAMFRLNALTAVALFGALVPVLRAQGQGALVAVGAGAALRASARMAAYAASKAAVLRLVEALAAECAAQGVRVNAVLPGVIDTPQNRSAMPDADFSRWVRPDEVAAAIAFLLSPAASGVTGAELAVTGRA